MIKMHNCNLSFSISQLIIWYYNARLTNHNWIHDINFTLRFVDLKNPNLNKLLKKIDFVVFINNSKLFYWIVIQNQKLQSK